MKFPKLSSLFRPSAFLVAAVIGLAVVAFLVSTSSYQRTPEVVSTSRTEKAPDASSAWSVFQDFNVGIRFRYPSSWGPVIVALDSFCRDGVVAQDAACEKNDYFFSGLEEPSDTLFMTVIGKDYARISYTEGYVGLLAADLNDESAVKAVCSNTTEPCITYRTPTGLLVTRLSGRLVDYVIGADFLGADLTRQEIIWHAHVADSGVIVFSDRIQYGTNGQNVIPSLEAIVASIEPLK